MIEQTPAKYVKIYRVLEKDTITLLLTDVFKLTKINLKDSAAKPVIKTGLQVSKPTYNNTLENV